MADVATAATMTPAQLRAAGSRLLGFYLGGGGAKVDALVDTAHFITKNGDTFEGLRAGDGDVLDVGKAGGQRLRLFASDDIIGLFNVSGAGAGRDGIQIGNDFVSFDINAAEIARVTANGIGIGTTAPSEKLEVAGNIRLSAGANRLIRLGSATNYYYDVAAVNDDFRVIAADGAQVLRMNYPDYNLMGYADNIPNLGHPSLRWGTLFVGTTPVVSCDVRFKTFRSDRQLREAEHAAALALFDTFGFCQFNDAIALKGVDGARPHFVPGAQEVYSVWADHGLCEPLVENDKGELVPPPGAVPPAFICFDLIDEETAPVTEGWRPSTLLGPDGQPVMVKCAEGEEATEQRPTGETIVTREAGHIFGVRTDQLHSVMIAALNTERKALTARIAALEPAA